MNSSDKRPAVSAGSSWQSAVLFIAVLFSTALLWSIVCDRAARADTSQKIVWTFRHKNNSYDFLVAGSSRANTATDVGSLGRILGTKGINLGEDGASYLESEAVLKHFLSANRACNLFLEVDSFGLSSKMEMGVNLWKYTPFLGDPSVDDYLHAVAGPKFYLWKWIPYAKYSEFNGRIGWRSVYHLLRRPPNSYDESGNSLLDGGYVEPASNRTRVIISDFDSTMSRSLARIVQYAQARGMNVVLYTAPEYAATLHLRQNRGDVMNYYKDFARARGIDFLQFDSLSLSTDSTKFRDSEHVNREGALIFSAALARELRLHNLVRKCTLNKPELQA